MSRRRLILGGGCFWCLEALYERLDGVEDVVSGYANGSTPNPTYHSVCGGDTGYAEVIEVTYDSSIIDAQTLLDIFFEIHDPTTLNRQGADVGTQYRSTVLYEDEATKSKALVAKHKAQENHQDPIVTIIEPLTNFYPAEAYHQDYYRQNMTQGYCKAVIGPKLTKFKEKFKEKLTLDT